MDKAQFKQMLLESLSEGEAPQEETQEKQEMSPKEEKSEDKKHKKTSNKSYSANAIEAASKKLRS